jgi:hypothetical protein
MGNAQLYLDENFLARWKQPDQTLPLDAQMKKLATIHHS